MYSYAYTVEGEIPHDDKMKEISTLNPNHFRRDYLLAEIYKTGDAQVLDAIIYMATGRNPNDEIIVRDKFLHLQDTVLKHGFKEYILQKHTVESIMELAKLELGSSTAKESQPGFLVKTVSMGANVPARQYIADSCSSPGNIIILFFRFRLFFIHIIVIMT